MEAAFGITEQSPEADDVRFRRRIRTNGASEASFVGSDKYVGRVDQSDEGTAAPGAKRIDRCAVNAQESGAWAKVRCQVEHVDQGGTGDLLPGEVLQISAHAATSSAAAR